MNNQGSNPRFDTFANVHNQFGSNPNLNAQRGQKIERMLTDKTNAKMEIDTNNEYLQDKGVHPPGNDFFMNAGLANPGFAFDPNNYLYNFPNNFGNGGQNPQAGYSGGNPAEVANPYMSGGGAGAQNPNNLFLQNNFNLGNFSGNAPGANFYDDIMKSSNPNEFWMQPGNLAFFGGDKTYLNDQNFAGIDNQFLLNGFDDFTLKQDLNSTNNNFNMLNNSNKMLQGLPLSGHQLGGLGNMQNPMILNNLYGLDNQNLSMLMPSLEEFYQMQGNNPGQMNPLALTNKQSNNNMNSNQNNTNQMPDLKIESNAPPTGNFNGRNPNENQGMMGMDKNYGLNGRMNNMGAGVNNYHNIGGSNNPASNPASYNAPAGNQGSMNGMNQYLNSLAKNFGGSDFEAANLQKYLHLLNGNNGNISEMLGQMDPRGQGPNPGSQNPPQASNIQSSNQFNMQNNYNNGLNPNVNINPNVNQDNMQKQMPQSQMNDYSKLLSMNNYMNPAGAAKPPSMLGAASEMDMFNRGMGAESWLMPPGSMKRDPMIFGTNSESYSKWRERNKYERSLKIEKYKNKKRSWAKKISYDCRKRVADTRLRIKGRFISKKDSEKINKLVGGKQEEAFNDKKNLNLDYITSKFNDRNETNDNALDAIANRSNMSKKDLLRKIDDVLNNSNGTITVSNISSIQLPPGAEAAQVLLALRQSANGKHVEQRIIEKIENKKKIFKILYKKINKGRLGIPDELDRRESSKSSSEGQQENANFSQSKGQIHPFIGSSMKIEHVNGLADGKHASTLNAQQQQLQQMQQLQQLQQLQQQQQLQLLQLQQQQPPLRPEEQQQQQEQLQQQQQEQQQMLIDDIARQNATALQYMQTMNGMPGMYESELTKNMIAAQQGMVQQGMNQQGNRQEMDDDEDEEEEDEEIEEEEDEEDEIDEEDNEEEEENEHEMRQAASTMNNTNNVEHKQENNQEMHELDNGIEMMEEQHEEKHSESSQQQVLQPEQEQLEEDAEVHQDDQVDEEAQSEQEAQPGLEVQEEEHVEQQGQQLQEEEHQEQPEEESELQTEQEPEIQQQESEEQDNTVQPEQDMQTEAAPKQENETRPENSPVQPQSEPVEQQREESQADAQMDAHEQIHSEVQNETAANTHKNEEGELEPFELVEEVDDQGSAPGHAIQP